MNVGSDTRRVKTTMLDYEEGFFIGRCLESEGVFGKRRHERIEAKKELTMTTMTASTPLLIPVEVTCSASL